MKSILNWVGGKSRLAKKIIERIPEHTLYIEPFVGAASVFLNKEPARYEVLNDLNGDLIGFYRCLQNHPEELIRQIAWLIPSRKMWGEYKSQLNSDGLTDIQRAARFYYVHRLGFGGRVVGKSYGATPSDRPRFCASQATDNFRELTKRFKRVQIENLPYNDLISRYDRQNAFLYIDPPYMGREGFYGKGFFSRADFDILAGLLANIKGKFLLSINDRPEVREIFGNFKIEPVKVQYSIKKDSNTAAKELFITNY